MRTYKHDAVLQSAKVRRRGQGEVFNRKEEMVTMNEEKKNKDICQVKVRGHWVEPGEIERHLLAYQGIKETVVTVIEVEGGRQELCAYVVPEFFDSLHMIDLVDLRGFLSTRLPLYMIPAYFVLLENLPLTAEGEINRERLPRPERAGREKYAAPRNKIEKQLVDIWAEVLHLEVDTIGIDTEFFDLGGHSLNAIRMLSRIDKELNVKLDINDVLEISTIRGLAALIKKNLKNASRLP